MICNKNIPCESPEDVALDKKKMIKKNNFL